MKQANNEYINYFLKLIINEFNNKYKEIYNEYKNDGINIYLKIKLIEINEEILKNNYYISTILYKIIDENWVGTKRKHYVKINAIILDYLRKSYKFVSRSDLYAWARSWGVKSSLVREYIKDMSEFYPDMAEVV